MPSFALQDLIDASARVLEGGGAPPDMARRLAEWLANANLSGHPSHGFQRVPEYIRNISERGWDPAARPTVISDSENSVLLDGRMGFGHFAAEDLTRRVSAKAKERGIAMGGVLRCTHIGRLGEWSELAAELGVVFLMCAGRTGGGQAAPFGGAEGRLWTNPLTFAAPAADGDGMMMDFATTASAEGKIRVMRDRGESLPEGWIMDKHGKPSTDPHDLYDGGLMLTFGAHKGYALSVMVSILAGSLVGSAAPSDERATSTFALAIDPGAFGDAPSALQAVGAELQHMRNTRPAEGFSEVQVPGDMERRSRDALRDQPIELPDATWTAFLAAADQVGLSRKEIVALAEGGAA